MLMTEQEARQTCCCGPVCIAEAFGGIDTAAFATCRASACMAWRIGPSLPETRRSDPAAQAALVAWLRDNPAPPALDDGTDAEWEAYDQVAADWEAAALAFVAGLGAPGTAPGPEWEWRHGIDTEGDGDIYALWVRPEMERGYCGLAGKPESH